MGNFESRDKFRIIAVINCARGKKENLSFTEKMAGYQGILNPDVAILLLKNRINEPHRFPKGLGRQARRRK